MAGGVRLGPPDVVVDGLADRESRPADFESVPGGTAADSNHADGSALTSAGTDETPSL